mgnify:CR=1 FL=1
MRLASRQPPSRARGVATRVSPSGSGDLEDGRCVGIRGAAMDITEEKTAEEKRYEVEYGCGDDAYLAALDGVLVGFMHTPESIVERAQERAPRERGYLRRRSFEMLVGRIEPPTVTGRRASRSVTGYVAADRGFGLLAMYFVTGAAIFSAFAFLGAPGWAFSRGTAVLYILSYGVLGIAPWYFAGVRCPHRQTSASPGRSDSPNRHAPAGRSARTSWTAPKAACTSGRTSMDRWPDASRRRMLSAM